VFEGTAADLAASPELARDFLGFSA
jgi:hypothetical protein